MSHADLAPTRRAVVAGGALLASSAPVLAGVPTSGIASETRLLALCAALDDCHVARQAYEEANPDDEDPFYDQHWDLRKQINGIEARTLPALRAKARAAEHAFFYDPTAACHCAGSFRELSRSIIADIARLQQVTA